jgi:hypothetical protein
MGEDAKKFVLQSIGRGVRIEPFKNIRRRMEILHKNSQIDKETYQQVMDWTTPIESLFVFGTKASNLETILQTLREQRQEEEKKNPKVQGKLLLVPEYEESELILRLHPEDKEIAREFLELDDRILVCMFDVHPKVLMKLRNNLDALVHADHQERKIGIPEAVLKRLFGYFSAKFYQY